MNDEMDIETLHANRERLMQAWLEGRREGEHGVGPVLSKKNVLTIMTWQGNIRSRDVVCEANGTIRWDDGS